MASVTSARSSRGSYGTHLRFGDGGVLDMTFRAFRSPVAPLYLSR